MASAPPRSYLFVPGHRADRFDKALASGSDAVVLDLEDAVAAADKDTARTAVAAWLAAQATERERIVVRINDTGTPHFAADAAMLRACRAATAMLPKCESAADLATLRAACPGIAVLALIESARGVLAAAEIARAEGCMRLVFGTIDYARDLGLPGDDASVLETPAALLALASRAAGLGAPVAGVTADIADTGVLVADWARARAHGYGAKLAIHPSQIAPIHAGLRPSAAELAHARRVLDAAQAAGGAAVQLDGRMIDRPVIERARALIERDRD